VFAVSFSFFGMPRCLRALSSLKKMVDRRMIDTPSQHLRRVNEAVVSNVEERVIREACAYASKKRAEGRAPQPVLAPVGENCKVKVTSTRPPRPGSIRTCTAVTHQHSHYAGAEVTGWVNSETCIKLSTVVRLLHKIQQGTSSDLSAFRM